MKLSEIAKGIDARLIPGPGAADREVSRVYAGDRISDLIEQAAPDTLLVTNIANAQLIRVAELMDVPGLCLVNGAEPAPELAAAAEKNGIRIMVSAAGLFATCGKLYLCLQGREGGGM
jgi:hypothetical protein